MSAKNKTTYRRRIFTGISALIGLLLSVNSNGQLTLSGATAVTLNSSYTYTPQYFGSSTQVYNGSYGYTITGGKVTGTVNTTTKSGTNSGVLYQMPINVTWTSPTGSLFLACGLGTVTLNVAVVGPLSAGTLSPSTQFINYNTTPSTINGTAATGGAATPNYQYQWWNSPDGLTWNTIGGATGLNYSPGQLTTTTYYKRQVTETTTPASDYTSAVGVTVYPQVACNITPLTQTIVSGSSAAMLTANPSGGNGSYTYQWQSSPDNSTWSNAGTASTLSPGILTSTYFYKVTATSNGISGTSSTASVSVCPSATSVGPVTGPSTCITGSTIQLANSVAGGSWSSNNTSVATVDANGVVTGKLDGTVTITYTLTNSCGTASAQLNINVVSYATVVQTLGTGIPDPVITDTISLVQNTIKTTVFVQDTLYSTAHSIKNVLAFRVIEESNKYIPGDFSALIVLQVEYGHSQTDIYLVDSIKLYVNYTKNGGNKYNALNYFTFNNAEFTRVKVLRIEAPTTVNGTSFDTKQVLLLTNTLAGTRYYKLADNKKPVLSYTNPSPGIVPDALLVNWVFPAHANNNGVQLEWTWLENEMADSYIINNVFDTSLLFKTGGTRIDLPVAAAAGGYDIPLLYGGAGKLFMRIRGVNMLPSGSRSDGPWSGIKTFAFSGHNDSLNWQATTRYADEGKRNTSLQYSDGSLRVRQIVTKDNVTQKTIVSETFYDGDGRPALQVLPAPGISNIISYTKNLNKFNTQADNTDPADFFDFSTATLGKYATTPLSQSTGAARYYSSQNPDANTGYHKNIPAANGFSYAVTRYTPDATGRVLREGGPGDSMTIGSSHAVKYFYGSAAKEELDALFGTEVGNNTHYFKNMMQDANGQMSVSYVDMHGRTVATALAGEAPAGVQALNVTDTTQYKNQAGKYVTRNLLDKGTNILKGNSIESVNSVLVPYPTSYAFNYTLAKQTLTLPKCGGGTVSYDCKFDLQISVSNESGDTDPVIYNYTGIDSYTFNQSLVLQAGSYNVRKTLTINQDSLDKFMQQYNTVNVGLCQTQQYLIDSITALDSTASGCGITTPPLTSGNCQATLGTWNTYLSNYATTLGYGSINQLSSQQVYDARNQYLSDSGFCASLNNNISHSLENIRKQMLSDMVPYSGQYARDTGTTAMYSKYNIFAPSGNPTYTQPLFRFPRLLPLTSPDYYYNAFGNIDSSVSLSRLQAMSMPDFEQEFKDSWTKSLLPYHPEFRKLKFAEDTLRTVFNYIDSIQQAVNIAFNPINTDPFFSVFSTGADKNLMKKYSDTVWQGTYSMWQLAYGEAFGCKANLDTTIRKTCYNNMPKVVTATGTSINTGSGSVTLSASIQLRAWSTYKAFYNMVRGDMVNRYINVHPGVTDTADNSNLINQKFRIYFPYNNVQQSQNLGWTGWYPNNNGVYPPVNLNDSVNIATSRCDSYINAWRNALMDCPALAAKDSVSREQILNSITGKMLIVCKNGTDGANPYGSSTVAPPYAGTTWTSFEQVVNYVLDSAGIAKNTMYCNPYGIEWPKPYGKNPMVTRQVVSGVEPCTCSQFYKLQTDAAAALYNPSSLTSMNQYLLATYQDTITTVLWQGLLQCGNYYLYNCRDTVINTCGHPGAYFSCTIKICDTVRAFPLASPQPLPFFLTCGFNSSQFGCFNCSNFKTLDTAFNTLFNRHPVFTGSITADSIVAWNDLFAKYVNFKTGLQHTWQYYADKFSTTGCAIGGIVGSGTGLSICLDKKPLNDTTGFTTTITPCQRVRNQATVKAVIVYESIRQQLMANFKAAYVNQCLAATETFKVSDTLKEYHYTLYYFDEAGNRVKTVPPRGVNPIYRQTWIDSVENFKLTGAQLTPKHSYITRFSYNSLNQVVLEKTPDGGVIRYYYDRLGRVVISQNAKQASTTNVYSYTKYDSVGRIIEIGQITGTSAMTDAIARSESSLSSWFTLAASSRTQITQTVYDTEYGPINGVTLSQKNLRNRVSYSQVINNAGDVYPASATYFSYDVHGNVDTLLQDYGNSTGIANAMNQKNRFKKLVRNYDQVSSRLIQVSYQPGQADAYYHRYVYDAQNRLIDVYSGRDSVMLFLFPEREAHYTFYKHGMLARTEYGQLRVQGADYAYTIQGWMKGINPTMGGTLANGTDTTEPYPVAQDVYGISMHHFKNDYKAIGYTPQATSVFQAPGSNTSPQYNGNIAAIGMNIPKLGAPKLNNYYYDQLRRLVAMDVYNGLAPVAGTFTPDNVSDYRERITYDPNGNILAYNRHGDAARTAMDSLSYFYKPNTNRLHKVTDAATDALPAEYSKYNDIKQGQADSNYRYDAIGNLIQDNAEGITDISWNIYGRISSTTKAGVITRYVYDAAGYRIMKFTAADTTIYVRDINGNVLSVYRKLPGDSLKQTEIDLYGSRRLGMATTHASPDTTLVLSGNFGSGVKSIFTRGEKIFELSNHLDNVLVTISDRRISVDNPADGIIDYYTADILSAQDFYPFGSKLPGRQFNNTAYRFGYNGKEEDDEAKGDGLQQDYGLRIYDPRLGRFLSVDPLTHDFPYYSPYHFAGNSPIKFLDLDGGEPEDYIDKWVHGSMVYQGTKTFVDAAFSNHSILMVDDPFLGWIDVECIYDKQSKKNFFVHRSNSGVYYYYKADDGNHGILSVKNRKNALPLVSSGSMVPFETENARQARIGAESADLLGKFFFWTFAAAFASESLLAAYETYGVNAVNNFIREQIVDEIKDQIFERVTGMPSIYRSGYSIMKAGLKKSGKAVLGHMEDEYWKYADEIGASKLYFSQADYDALLAKGCDWWTLNKRYLDEIAERGDEIIIRAKNGIRPGSTLEAEVEYLMKEKGYDWIDEAKTILGKKGG